MVGQNVQFFHDGIIEAGIIVAISTSTDPSSVVLRVWNSAGSPRVESNVLVASPNDQARCCLPI